MPARWYNVLHDLPTPPPPVLHPGTGQPVGPDDLAPPFPAAPIEQEVTGAQYVEIPGEVLDVYRLWRPSPLFVLFARTEGILPAPEPTHAPAVAIEEARRCVATEAEKVILTALCGHGHLDLPAYGSYLAGTVTDHAWGDADTQAALRESLAALPQLPG